MLNISSDAAVEAYETWGGYGSSKAALDHASRVLAAEEPDLRVYAVDPGDMRTAMHQAAFPGEDISDRPPPATVAPRVLDLLHSGLPSGRYRAADLGRDGGRAMSSEPGFGFRLPPASSASTPPEARGLARDEVRMAVARPSAITHARVRDLPGAAASRRPAGREHQRHAARGRRPRPARQSDDRALLDRARRRLVGGGAPAAGRVRTRTPRAR